MARSDDDEAAGPEDHHRRAGAHTRAQPPQTPTQDATDKQAHNAIAGSVDDRVFVIAQYLVQGRWSKHKALMLANLWAVSAPTMRGYAADAARLSRQLKGADGLRTLRRKVESQLDMAFEMAVASGDAKAAVAAAKALGEMGGVFAPKKIAATDAEGKTLPPNVAVFVNDERALRLWALTRQRPTPAQVAQLEAGVPPEEVARSAGLLQGPLSRS
jgi:hypothetical protein